MIGVDVLMQLIKRYQPIQKHMQGKEIASPGLQGINNNNIKTYS